MKVKELMKKPIVIEKDLMLSDAAKIMVKYSINSIPVVKDENLLGIITAHDLVKNFGEQKKISEVMSTSISSMNENDKIQDAIEIIQKKDVDIIPVLNAGGKLVGIIDTKDIVKKACDNEDFFLD